MKDKLSGLTGLHGRSNGPAGERLYGSEKGKTEKEYRDLPRPAVVEHPVTGDPQRGLVTSGFFPPTGGVNFMMEQSNRGKRSVGIDLGNPRGLGVLHDLVKDADVLYSEVKPRGALIAYEPVLQEEYGNREFGVRDLDGYLLAFGSDAS